jgi:hypothetical protein
MGGEEVQERNADMGSEFLSNFLRGIDFRFRLLLATSGDAIKQLGPHGPKNR